MSSADTGQASGATRRWFLAGGAAAVVAGGVGVGVGFWQPDSTPAPRPAPRALRDALAAEQHLLALAATALRQDPTLRADVAALTADHAAHLRALRAALARFDALHPTPAPAPTLSTTSPVRAQLRAAERAAATTAAARADRLVGGPATLLASISACEASHAELLT